MPYLKVSTQKVPSNRHWKCGSMGLKTQLIAGFLSLLTIVWTWLFNLIPWLNPKLGVQFLRPSHMTRFLQKSFLLWHNWTQFGLDFELDTQIILFKYNFLWEMNKNSCSEKCQVILPLLDMGRVDHLPVLKPASFGQTGIWFVFLSLMLGQPSLFSNPTPKY